MHGAGPQRSGEAVPVLSEQKQRVVADGLEVPVVGAPFLRVSPTALPRQVSDFGMGISPYSAHPIDPELQASVDPFGAILRAFPRRRCPGLGPTFGVAYPPKPSMSHGLVLVAL